ncbi:MAG: LacI family DNA-binding transcriptional regulator [Mycobacteriales bacterium]
MGVAVARIEDVARHAGVSPSTVSYVLSGKRSISAETRRRVEESIRLLGYHPHAGARALASNRSNVIALVIPLRSGIHVPVLMQFAIAVTTAARRHDHDVLLLTQEEGVDGLHRVARSALVDALIVMDVELRDARIPVLRGLDRPAVLIGFPADAGGLTCIDLDFQAAGARCVDHLADLGHRRIALVGPPQEVYDRGTGFAARTVDGFRRAADRRGVDADIHPCQPTQDGVRALADRLLAAEPAITGVVVHNEPAVAPLLAAFRERGRRVPDDLSVVVISPDELAEHADPPLTSITIPAEDVGRSAVDLVMAKLAGDDVPSATLLAPALVTRASTRCPAHR